MAAEEGLDHAVEAMLGGDEAAFRLVYRHVQPPLLRYLTVVQVAFPRFAKQDLELYGCPVRKDDVIAVSLSGANRDPAWAL